MTEPHTTESVGPLPETAPAGNWPPGRLLADRYEIRESLGRGGHATVYLAFDRLLKAEVALKVVRPDRDPERALARIRREVGVARESLSPHLVRVFELGQGQGGIYLTMELLSGGSLRDRLHQGLPPIPEALRIGEAVFQGLAALHDKGVVHRDVTPGNVLFSDSGEVKLADFGLARRLGREETRITAEGGVLGTVGYLSPEQLLGKDVGPRSDLYAAGLVLFEMLAGRLPHEAASDLGRRLGPLQVAPDLCELRPEVPRWLARIVARLLEVSPANRYPSAEAVLDDLRHHRSPSHVRLRRWLFRAALISLLFLPQTGVLVTPAPGATFSHLVPLGKKGIAAVDATGKRLWKIDDVDPDMADRAALARITPDGPRLIAIVLAKPWDWSPESISTLSFLDPASGRVVKRVKLPVGAELFPNDPPRFTPFSVKALDLFRDGMHEVLVSYRHVPEAPSYTVLYAPRSDRARVIFYARGSQGFEGATDLDGDGSPELLFAGVNNGWNWVNVVAAVRLDPWPWAEQVWGAPPAGAPDVLETLGQDQYLLWYAIIPRGHLDFSSCLSIDERQRKLTIHYRSGKIWALGFNGFPPEASSVAAAVAREKSRRETYGHLREAERLRRAGALDLALLEAQAAFRSAGQARETWLGQYAERLEAKLLVFEGKIPEAEARFVSLTESAEDTPEVAYDAAVAFHLHGNLRRAVAWYERGLGRDSAMGAGKSKHEFLKGEVLALVEERRYGEALSAVDRFGATYPVWQTSLWLFREYVRWRAGERPQVDPAGVPLNFTDLDRYWALEFEFAAGGSPREILPRVDRFLAERPETRAELLSLRAELLARMGRIREAEEIAQSALELVRVEKARSIVARAHEDLLAKRARHLREPFRTP